MSKKSPSKKPPPFSPPRYAQIIYPDGNKGIMQEVMLPDKAHLLTVELLCEAISEQTVLVAKLKNV